MTLKKIWINITLICIVLFCLSGCLFAQDSEHAFLTTKNGWYLDQSGNVICGYTQHNGWWGGYRNSSLSWVNEYKVRTAICRHDPDKIGPSHTEDLSVLTDAMVQYGYPGFEHNYGLWYDRRRDAHDTNRRKDGNVSFPVIELPWARSNVPSAWDGLNKYDLTKWNPWYFNRVKEFAENCNDKGAILIYNFFLQHNFLEDPAHYADSPWRPVNCIQNTGLPDDLPASGSIRFANEFYSSKNKELRILQRLYIRKCLDEFSHYRNIVYLCSEEYTGPASFMVFWLHVIIEWEREHQKKVHVGLSATKDVMDSILQNSSLSSEISTIDLRHFWYRADGTLHAPAGGQNLAPRETGNINKAPNETNIVQFYRHVREYRNHYPDKAIICAGWGERRGYWAFFMAGGSLSISDLNYADSPPPANPWDPPAQYVKPPACNDVLPAHNFIRKYLGTSLKFMKPMDVVENEPEHNWALVEPGQNYLIYALQGGGLQINLLPCKGKIFFAEWLNPRNGELSEAGFVKGGQIVSINAPDNSTDWALWLSLSGKKE